MDHEGVIRANAVDLINGKSQQFYDDLLNYTMNYTSKSRFEFDKLWNDAYDALLRYGNGVIDVDATLAFLIGKIAAIDDQMEALENQINNTKNAATQFIDGFKDGLEGVGKVIAEDIEAVNELGNSAATAISKASTAANAATGYTVASAGAHSYWHTPTQSEIMNSSTAFNTKRTDSASVIASNLSKAKAGIIDFKDIFKFHDGGLVPHQGIRKNSEVFAKLLAGEVVVTQDQASAFMNSTLPKLANANVTNNNAAPTITIGDINIAGNADSNTVSQLKEVQKQIVDDVFKTINSRNSMYNGGRIK